MFNVITVVVQTLGHKERDALIWQLECAIVYLKEGKTKGIEHDDDSGFYFSSSVEVSSIFGEECAGRRFE